MATISAETKERPAAWSTPARVVISLILAFCVFSFLSQLEHRITALDFIAIGCGIAVATTMIMSFLRDPRQFAQALWERTVFTVWVPTACCLIVAVFIFRIGFIMLKISFKLIFAGIVAVAYVLFPIDLVPDLIIGFGQIDDVIIVISLTVWAMGAVISDSLRSSITVTRPTTPFP